MTTFHLAGCTVRVSPLSVETVLPNGATVLGEPMETADYCATSLRLGYGDDVARLNRCHEVGHSILAAFLGLDASPVFERIAAGQHEPTDLTRAEESAVCAIEAFANALGVDLERVAATWSERR